MKPSRKNIPHRHPHAAPIGSHFVVFSTPSLEHKVSLEYLRSWSETIPALANAGISFTANHHGGDCFVAKVRSRLATEFLTQFPKATDLFFLDDDIGWPAEKVVEFINRPEDVLAGIYPKKQDDKDFPVELEAERDTGKLIERDGLVRALAVPTGFLRIKRHVIEKLAAEARPFKQTGVGGRVETYQGIFQAGIGPDGWWWGEDYCFSNNWTAMGGEIWVDPSIPFSHRGDKTWRATLADNLDVFRSKGAAFVREAAE